jgi:diguanylate cyclase (GGDEF)-like protein
MASNAHPAMISYLSAAMVLIGVVIQAAAMAPARRLIGMLPVGSLRNKWFAMTGLIIMFILGYVGYVVVLWGRPTEWHDLPIPGIFVFGAIFVWLTTSLSLQTAVDLLRISMLEIENVTDPLTQVYNRRYLDRRLEEEIVRSKRYGLDLSILLLDIDHFKRVNDTYGHQAGDAVLSALGSLIKTTLREPDVAARYGGEEFLIVCVSTAIDGAGLVAERLRHLVESHQVEIADDSGGRKTIQISISVGAAGLSGNVDSMDKLVQAADKALYRAKQEGRNRVVIATPEVIGTAAAGVPGSGLAELPEGIV